MYGEALRARLRPIPHNSAIIRNCLILSAGGAIGAILSVWFLDDWVWGAVFYYAHGHGERLASLRITAVVGMLAGMLCTAEVWRLVKR